MSEKATVKYQKLLMYRCASPVVTISYNAMLWCRPIQLPVMV